MAHSLSSDKCADARPVAYKLAEKQTYISSYFASESYRKRRKRRNLEVDCEGDKIPAASGVRAIAVDEEKERVSCEKYGSCKSHTGLDEDGKQSSSYQSDSDSCNEIPPSPTATIGNSLPLSGRKNRKSDHFINTLAGVTTSAADQSVRVDVPDSTTEKYEKYGSCKSRTGVEEDGKQSSYINSSHQSDTDSCNEIPPSPLAAINNNSSTLNGRKKRKSDHTLAGVSAYSADQSVLAEVPDSIPGNSQPLTSERQPQVHRSVTSLPMSAHESEEDDDIKDSELLSVDISSPSSRLLVKADAQCSSKLHVPKENTDLLCSKNTEKCLLPVCWKVLYFTVVILLVLLVTPNVIFK